MKVVLMGKVINQYFRSERHPCHMFTDTKIRVLITEDTILGYDEIKEMNIIYGLNVGDYVEIENNQFRIEKIVARENEVMYYTDYIKELRVNNESKEIALKEIEESLMEERKRIGGNYV
jgi:ABC-type uncharacterized transport system substrate-binding protein